jgi:hypothetical protein
MSVLAERFKTQLPFIVGVTGHRQLEAADEPWLRAQVGVILDDLKARLKATPLVMLCGMAPGADLICAQEAIARNIALCALLPVPVDEFARDFSDADRARLRAALDAAVETRVLDDNAERGYVRLAEYLSRFSHLVIALWDGAEGEGSGGTADVVRMRLEGLPNDRLAKLGIEVHAYPDVGPVVHIPTRRADGPALATHISVKHPPRFEGDLTAHRDYDAATARLDKFNADMQGFGIRPDRTRSFHAGVDMLSNALQSRITWITAALYVIGAAAATVHLLDWDARIRTGFIALGLIAFIIARQFDLENRYQDYRALSEALRVREAWRVGGITASVESFYLRMYQSELQWIRMALRTTDLVDPPPRDKPLKPMDGACAEWLEGQWRFYKRARVRAAHYSTRTELASRTLLVIGAVCVVLAWALPQGDRWFHSDLYTLISDGFASNGQAWFALGAALGAILASYGEKRGFATNAKRYERMFFVFDTVKRRLAQLQPEAAHEAEAIILELGREALVEHADWLLQRRERPLSFIQG